MTWALCSTEVTALYSEFLGWILLNFLKGVFSSQEIRGCSFALPTPIEACQWAQSLPVFSPLGLDWLQMPMEGSKLLSSRQEQQQLAWQLTTLPFPSLLLLVLQLSLKFISGCGRLFCCCCYRNTSSGSTTTRLAAGSLIRAAAPPL